MAFTSENYQASWTNLGLRGDQLQAETLSRLFIVHPLAQTYFPHFDMIPNSQDVQRHGQKVVEALDSAIKHLDNLSGTLADLSDLHAYNLPVDPVNFKERSEGFLEVLACRSDSEFNTPVYRAKSEFLHLVDDVLDQKYS